MIFKIYSRTMNKVAFKMFKYLLVVLKMSRLFEGSCARIVLEVIINIGMPTVFIKTIRIS
jgi:hypothetical protein